MSRFWEIVFCVPLLFRRHVCYCKLKHSPSRELPLTARETVCSHLSLSYLTWIITLHVLAISDDIPLGTWPPIKLLCHQLFSYPTNAHSKLLWHYRSTNNGHVSKLPYQRWLSKIDTNLNIQRKTRYLNEFFSRPNEISQLCFHDSVILLALEINEILSQKRLKCFPYILQ